MIHTFDQSLVLVRFASQSGSPPAARRNRSRAGALGLPPAIAIIGGERRASMTITIAPLMPMAVGDQLQAAILRSIELLGTVVAPQVRAEFAKRSVSA
jgi:hypothetical protein